MLLHITHEVIDITLCELGANFFLRKIIILRHINKVMPVGSKLMVWKGVAEHTSGGLRKEDLMVNSRGKVVSRKAHEAGKRAFKRNGLKPKSASEMRAMKGRGDAARVDLHPHTHAASY